MSDAELLTDLAQVALPASFILHDRSAADHFQVRDLCQVGQNFVLHAVGEIGVLLFIAQVVEWKHSNALRGDGGYCWSRWRWSRWRRSRRSARLLRHGSLRKNQEPREERCDQQ